VQLRRGDHAVNARKSCHLVDRALGVEIEHHERAVAEVGDEEAPIHRVDPLVVEP
jgi:hypothetical protein